MKFDLRSAHLRGSAAWWTLCGLVALAFGTSSCRKTGSASNAAPPTARPAAAPVSRDVNRLSRHIRLPFRPLAALWQIEVQGTPVGPRDLAPGPTDWNLTAVLTFRPGDMQKIVANAARRPAPGGNGQIMPPSWLPPSVRNHLVHDAGDHAYRLRGPVLDAADFMKPGLLHGFMVRIGQTSQVYLYLYTM